MVSESKLVLEDRVCPNGCAPDDRCLFVATDRLTNQPGSFSVVQCCCCGLIRTNPRPTPESIGVYYPDDYGPYVGTRIDEGGSRRHSLFKRWVIRLLEHNGERVPEMAPGQMLEVGCASGRFLKKMAEQGWSVRGIEFSPSASAAARAAGFEVHTGSLEQAPAPTAPYDLIVAWMVIEHLHDPLTGLRKLREWAAPGARLAFSVPNAASLEFRVFKDRWYALQVPTHLYHFTPESIARLLKQAGWKVERVLHQRILTNLLLSLACVAEDKGFSLLSKGLLAVSESRASLLLHPVAWLLALFGQTGRMTVWARVSEE